MYQALYRKYRPRRFGDVAGQEHITETLRRQIVGGRLSHAYLFVGTRGTGKTTCAKILSRAVNCINPEDGEPCNTCTACVGIEDGSILDVLELDAASNNSVDNVRALRDEAIYSPATVKKRVYIIDEVHMLSLSAFNALLKILEEPPEHILFILATTELHKVPATIQGRCQKFSFKRLSLPVLTDRLNLIASSEGLTLSAEAVSKLAALADGSMRDGVSLLDQCATDDNIDLARVLNTLGLAGQQEVLRLTEIIASRDTVSVLKSLDELYNDGRDMPSLLNELAAIIRDLLVCKISPDSGLINAAYDPEVFIALSGKMTSERLFYCLDVLKTAISGLTRSGSSKLAVEMSLIRMCDERLSDEASALLSRISRLERYGVGTSDLTASVSNAVEKPGAIGKPESVAAEAEVAEDKVEELEAVAEVAEDKVEEPVPQTEAAVAEVVEEPEAVAATENVSDDAIAEATEKVADMADSNGTEPVDFWADILELLKSEPHVHALLSNGSKVQARHEENALIVNMADFFDFNLVQSEFSGLLKEAAEKVFKRNIVVRVEEGGIVPVEDKRSKLDDLMSAFDIANVD